MPNGLALGKEIFKKNKSSLPSVFRVGARQRIFFKKIKNLCRVPRGLALGKENFQKKLKKSLPSACRVDTRQSDRQRDRRRDGRFSLPSVPGALGKVPDKRHSGKRALPSFVVFSLPSAALGKGFAKCNLAFAKCFRHSAKNLNPVVYKLTDNWSRCISFILLLLSNFR